MRRLLATLPLLLLACDRKVPAPSGALAAMAQAPPDASQVPSVAAWRSLGDKRPSFAGPHRGSFQKVYLNDVASRALDRNRFNPWPDGSQIVKEAFDAQGARMGWFWMSKESGQWVWAQAGVDGKVDDRMAGTENACAACHLARAEKFDGTFAPVFAGKGTLDVPMK